MKTRFGFLFIFVIYLFFSLLNNQANAFNFLDSGVEEGFNQAVQIFSDETTTAFNVFKQVSESVVGAVEQIPQAGSNIFQSGKNAVNSLSGQTVVASIFDSIIQSGKNAVNFLIGGGSQESQPANTAPQTNQPGANNTNNAKTIIPAPASSSGSSETSQTSNQNTSVVSNSGNSLESQSKKIDEAFSKINSLINSFSNVGVQDINAKLNCFRHGHLAG